MHQLAILSQDFDYYQSHLELPKNLALTYASDTDLWVEQLAEADIILAEPDLIIRHIDKCHKLKWLQSTWAGNRALLQHSYQEYQLTGVKQVFGQPMAEYVFAYLLYFSRNIQGFIQAQQQGQWQAPTFGCLKGKHIAILGTGSIGKEVAKRAKQFSMLTTGFSRSAQPLADFDASLPISELALHAHKFDFLLSLLPDTPDTSGLLNLGIFQALPQHAIVINAGRGNVINDQHLITALQQNWLQAAVLDVFEQEPLPRQHAYWQLPNCFVTQHTAARSLPEDILPLFQQNLAAFIQGQPLMFELDFNQGY